MLELRDLITMHTQQAEKTGEDNSPFAPFVYQTQVDEQIERLIDWFIDHRGCSRLVAAGYALQAVKMRYDKISESL